MVADWSVPSGQLRMMFPPETRAAMVAGGLTVTVVVEGADEQAPTIAVTLNSPEALVDAFAIEGF